MTTLSDFEWNFKIRMFSILDEKWAFASWEL